MQTKEIVQSYYDGIAQKNGWQSVISDEIAFTGPGSNTVGKNAYIEATAQINHSYSPALYRRVRLTTPNAFSRPPEPCLKRFLLV